MSSFLIFWGERIRTSEMAGPKPAALPLGDAPSRHLTIIEYQAQMSRTFFHAKRAAKLRLLFLLVNRLRRVKNSFYAVALLSSLSAIPQITSPTIPATAPAAAIAPSHLLFHFM